MNWHSLSKDAVIRALNSDGSKGLTDAEVQKRLKKYGKNTIEKKKRNGFLKKLILQFNDFMIIVLLAAAGISFISSYLNGKTDFADPIVILLIVLLNAILGTVQEAKAEKEIEHLKKMSEPTATVRRNGKTFSVSAEEICPGDILIFKSGARIAADCRIISSSKLQADESSLTGESVAVNKSENALIPEFSPIAERTNMVYSGTAIVSGKGEGVAVATGMNTEFGKIAGLIMDSENPETPLQKKLSHIGKLLGILALIICFVIFIIGVLKNFPPFEMFMISVSLAVAAIPEGLPAIVTIMLSFGTRQMARQNAVVRNLSSVETLGNASVICSDKTGTLTANKMKVTEIYSDCTALLLKYAVLCCDSESASPNPTETAIVEYAETMSLKKSRLEKSFPRVSDIPFDSTRKMMSTCHKSSSGAFIAAKGAPDILIELSDRIYKDGNICKITVEQKNKILQKNKEMASKALRVIAVAYKPTESSVITENKFIFLGLIGIEDPPRPEVADAVKKCIDAGISPVMITGDHLHTAVAIAKKIGIYSRGKKAITGTELDLMPQDSLEQNIEQYSVFARATPEQKVRIVEAWQKRNKTVAMTGDGVNDAPALKKADIGCSMGISGTDVAKSASDIVLADDNFATIVSAVKKGREIYDNLKKSIKFLLSSNIGEIATVFVGLLFGWSAPLFPIQLLWINLVTDSLPAIALGLDPPADDIMKRKPEKNTKSIFTKSGWFDIFTEGALIGALAIMAYTIGMVCFDHSPNAAIGRTMAFSVLGLSQLVHAFNMRSEHSVFKAGLLKNKFLVFALLLGITLQVAIISVPALAALFKVVSLNRLQWLVVAVLSFMPVPIIELQKLIRNK